jgi:hypothetical protein
MTDNFIAVTILLILNFRKETAPGLNIRALFEIYFGWDNSFVTTEVRRLFSSVA